VRLGFIAALPTLTADFGNLFVAPLLFHELRGRGRATTLGNLVLDHGLLHVVMFYGQGLIACLANTFAAGAFIVGLSAANLLLVAFYVVVFFNAPVEISSAHRKYDQVSSTVV